MKRHFGLVRAGAGSLPDNMFSHDRVSARAARPVKAFSEGLSKANRRFLPSPDKIPVGQRLCVPDFASG
ncbi:hypothetical protein DZK27_16425 [Rhodobacteraceae bacterium 63075]|nr:hypothetical protein DZK27_16425 [Rhodobacteraceae bacterium 63075]